MAHSKSPSGSKSALQVWTPRPHTAFPRCRSRQASVHSGDRQPCQDRELPKASWSPCQASTKSASLSPASGCSPQLLQIWGGDRACRLGLAPVLIFTVNFRRKQAQQTGCWTVHAPVPAVAPLKQQKHTEAPNPSLSSSRKSPEVALRRMVLLVQDMTTTPVPAQGQLRLGNRNSAHRYPGHTRKESSLQEGIWPSLSPSKQRAAKPPNDSAPPTRRPWWPDRHTRSTGHPLPTVSSCPRVPVWPVACPPDPGHGARRVALPRHRSAAVTRTVGLGQRSVRWAGAALRPEGLPGGRTEGSTPHPSPPTWASEPRRPCPARSPAAPAGGRPLRGAPPANLGSLARHLRPRRGVVAGSRPNFSCGRGHPRAPCPPRAQPPHAQPRMQMTWSRSQWSAEPGPPYRNAASGREGDSRRPAHRRAALRGRGWRVLFCTSARGGAAPAGRGLRGASCEGAAGPGRAPQPGGWYGPRWSSSCLAVVRPGLAGLPGWA